MSDSTTPLRCCTKCGIEKPLSIEFFGYEKSRNAFRTVCRACRNAASRTRRHDPINSGTKTCNTCNIDYPATTKFFYAHYVNRDGLKGQCKQCYTQTHSLGLRNTLQFGVPDGYKRCSICAKILLYTPEYFHRRYTGNDKNLLAHCKDCARNKFADWRKINGKWLVDNTKRWRQQNPDSYRKLQRRHRLKYPEKSRIRTHKRLARKRQLPNNCTPDNWEACLEYWQHRCAACGRTKDETITIAADHWIPLSWPDCPGTIAANMIPLCHGIDGCNNTKWAHDPEIWLQKRFGVQDAQVILSRINAYFEWVTEQ